MRREKVIKSLTNRQSRIFSSIILSVLGLIMILFPIISGWGEIFFPGKTQDRYLIPILLLALTTGVFIFHIVSCFVALLRSKSSNLLAWMLVPVILLFGVGYLFYPPGITATDRRIASFPLGAQARILWAGGSTKVRTDALELLSTSTNATPPASEWPTSLASLGAVSIKLDRWHGRVEIILPRPRFMYMIGDQFGYLISDETAEEPKIDTLYYNVNGYRLWQIADGIYLYEIW